jgi:hypothetical protein
MIHGTITTTTVMTATTKIMVMTHEEADDYSTARDPNRMCAKWTGQGRRQIFPSLY